MKFKTNLSQGALWNAEIDFGKKKLMKIERVLHIYKVKSDIPAAQGGLTEGTNH